MISEEQVNKIIELLTKIEYNTREVNNVYDELNRVLHLVDDIKTMIDDK